MISLRSFLGLLALLALPLACISQQGTDVECLSDDCLKELDQLLAKYNNPTYTFDSCDIACVQACGQTLKTAILADKSSDCPYQEDITRCFQIYAPEWEEYVIECPIFKSISQSAAAEAEAAAAAAVGDGEAAATTNAKAEAAATKTTAEAEAPAEAPAAEEVAEAEAGFFYNSVAAESETEEERLEECEKDEASGEGEGESGGPAGNGCFPPFDSVEEFDSYMKGTYWTTDYDSETNTAGIIMSVFFWIGLAGMGFFLRN